MEYDPQGSRTGWPCKYILLHKTANYAPFILGYQGEKLNFSLNKVKMDKPEAFPSLHKYNNKICYINLNSDQYDMNKYYFKQHYFEPLFQEMLPEMYNKSIITVEYTSNYYRLWNSYFVNVTIPPLLPENYTVIFYTELWVAWMFTHIIKFINEIPI